MLGAVYYPHTAVRDENFLKHALLYWDQIEYISPWEDFDALPRYLTESTKALSKFLVPHVPTKAEKERAHAEIMGLVDTDLPSWLQMDRVAEDQDHQTFSMFRNKLLPETWQELKERGMVQFKRHGDLDDYVSHTYLGLTLMAILAKCCAGGIFLTKGQLVLWPAYNRYDFQGSVISRMRWSQSVPLALIGLTILAGPMYGQSETRSLCVAPNSGETPQRCGAAPGLCASGEISLRIDRLSAQPWPKSSAKIDGLSADEQHRVVIYSCSSGLECAPTKPTGSSTVSDEDFFAAVVKALH
jgi:hypothetical protein